MNPKELEILRILLHADEPLSLPDILKLRPDLVKSTTAATLAKLLKDKMIEVAGIGRSGKVICRSYLATERAKGVLVQNILDDYTDVSDIISKADLCVSLLDMTKDPGQAREELASLRAMLDRYERENGWTGE